MAQASVCPTCGQSVELVSSDEGTSYYRGLAAERVEELERALDAMLAGIQRENLSFGFFVGATGTYDMETLEWVRSVRTQRKGAE